MALVCSLCARPVGGSTLDAFSIEHDDYDSVSLVCARCLDRLNAERTRHVERFEPPKAAKEQR